MVIIGTIVGSAAFNLLVICAVCVMAIPNGETRNIRLFNVSLGEIEIGHSMDTESYLWSHFWYSCYLCYPCRCLLSQRYSACSRTFGFWWSFSYFLPTWWSLGRQSWRLYSFHFLSWLLGLPIVALNLESDHRLCKISKLNLELETVVLVVSVSGVLIFYFYYLTDKHFPGNVTSSTL